jgi:DNA-binding CsgD family transcriptional regulator
MDRLPAAPTGQVPLGPTGPTAVRPRDERNQPPGSPELPADGHRPGPTGQPAGGPREQDGRAGQHGLPNPDSRPNPDGLPNPDSRPNPDSLPNPDGRPNPDGLPATGMSPTSGRLPNPGRVNPAGLPAHSRSPGPRLTSRELGIVFLMSAGNSTREIAALLDLRPRTVENHKRHIYEKLGVSSQSHAVALAISLGLLDQPRSHDPGPGTPPLSLVHGAPGPCRDEVLRTLITQGLAYMMIDRRGRALHESWENWYRGPLVVVLVDPEPADWALPASLAATTAVVRSGVRDPSAILDALRRGASGLVFADDVAGALGPVLRIVSRGLFAMSGVYAGALAKWAPEEEATAPQLTARETDILRSIASGHTIRQTARTLGIAAKTVENTQARLFRKLGARNRTETLAIADRWGLVDWATARTDDR